jgi:hypothetical protein
MPNTVPQTGFRHFNQIDYSPQPGFLLSVSYLKNGTAKTPRTLRREEARETLCALCVLAVKNPLSQ